MRLKQILLLFLCCSYLTTINSSNVPLLFNGNANQLFNLNPAFHGEKSGYKRDYMNFGFQTMYSSQYEGAQWQYPVFNTLGGYGCFAYDHGGIRNNATISNFYFSSGSNISNKFRIGYGGSIDIEKFDRWANGLNLNFGISFQKIMKNQSLSLGFNIKNDNYNAKIQYPEQNPVDVNFKTVNADIGLAYINRTRGLKVGLSVFNLNNTAFSYSLNPSFYSNQDISMYYYRLGIFNLNKNFKISDKINLTNSLIGILADNYGITCEQISIISNMNFKINSNKTFGVGVAIKPMAKDYDGLLIGPSVSYFSSGVVLQYSYQRFVDQRSSYAGGMHEIGLKYSVRLSPRRTITPNF